MPAKHEVRRIRVSARPDRYINRRVSVAASRPSRSFTAPDALPDSGHRISGLRSARSGVRHLAQMNAEKSGGTKRGGSRRNVSKLRTISTELGETHGARSRGRDVTSPTFCSETLFRPCNRGKPNSMKATAASSTMAKAFVAWAILYVLILKALLTAAMPLPLPAPIGGIICTHDGRAPDQPVDSHALHDGACCTTPCTGLPTLAPEHAVYDLPWPAHAQIVRNWPTTTGAAPRPPPRLQATPRGPPSIV